MAVILNFVCIIDENMKKILHLFIVLLGTVFITFSLSAQKRVLKGYIKDSSTHQPLTNVVVSDAFANILTHTDEKGYFNVKLKDGQTVFFDAPNYHFDTIRLATMTPDTVTVFLVQLPNVLAAVTVTTKGYTKYQKDSIKRRQDFVDAAGPKMSVVSNVNSGSGFGIAFNLDRLISKKERNRKNAYSRFDDIEESNYVDFRFPRDLVAAYTGLKSDDLGDFVLKYRPTYKWLRNHPTDEDVFYYINEKLKEFVRKKSH